VNQIARWLVSLGAIGIVGCATQAPLSSSAAPASSAGRLTPASATQADTGVAPAAAAPVQSQADAQVPLPYGYTHVVRHGKDFYCRKDVTTGSRVEKEEVCLTLSELQGQRDSSEDFVQRLQRNGTASTIHNTPGAGGAASPK